ncbi:hypothetical protein DFP72DRAFT_839191 [Ephemerocybe angulata]|uniref:Uncharacterized protein n=1 Tax=Ephemerocybe angulata TaxID=980116 RepID=A0A8H6MGU4_9AGAR|nr:hypothetical protein DFP72DRAFT_839191 [Tulosesus angulatus]
MYGFVVTRMIGDELEMISEREVKGNASTSGLLSIEKCGEPAHRGLTEGAWFLASSPSTRSALRCFIVARRRRPGVLSDRETRSIPMQSSIGLTEARLSYSTAFGVHIRWSKLVRLSIGMVYLSRSRSSERRHLTWHSQPVEGAKRAGVGVGSRWVWTRPHASEYSTIQLSANPGLRITPGDPHELPVSRTHTARIESHLGVRRGRGKGPAYLEVYPTGIRGRMEECQNRGDGAGMTIQTRRVYEGGRWRQRGGYEGWMEGWKDGRGLYCLFGWSIERRHSIIGTRWVHKATFIIFNCCVSVGQPFNREPGSTDPSPGVLHELLTAGPRLEAGQID